MSTMSSDVTDHSGVVYAAVATKFLDIEQKMNISDASSLKSFF